MSKNATPSLQLCGTFIAFNVSPKGHIEGAMLETATGLAQVNFSRHNGHALAQSMHAGSKVEISAELETKGEDHPVFSACESEGEAGGTIVRLNYAMHGAVNGYHLEDGTFIHVKPDEAKKYSLRVGDKVKATGKRRPGTDAVVFEPDALKRVV